VGQLQADGVQEETVQVVVLAEKAVVLALAVVDVADERARDVLQVAAHLVQAAGERACLDQAVAAEDLAATEFRLCGHTRGTGILAGRQRVIDETTFRRHSTYQGQIGLLCVSLGEAFAHTRSHRGRQGEQQHAAGRPVQAMHRKHRNPQLVAHTGQRHHTIPRPAPVHGQPRWLVHSHQESIAIKNVQRTGHAPKSSSKVISLDRMITCKLCQAAPCSTLPPRGPRTFHLCPSCGLVFVPDREWLSPDDERARYRHHDNTPDSHDYVCFLNEMMAQVEALGLGDQPILDFGSGEHAVLADLLKTRGLICTAYDPLYDSTQLAGPYALIIICEVIEHLRDLRGELARLRGLLTANGKILVRTQPYPSVEQIPAWWYSRDPTHISFFSEHTLAHAASLLGRGSTRLTKDIFLWG